MVQCADTTILPASMYNRFTEMFDVKDPADKLMNVGLANQDELQGMPRTAFVVSGWDMLRDEAFIFAEKLEKLGFVYCSCFCLGFVDGIQLTSHIHRVPTKKHIFPGLPHAFQRYAELKSSERYVDVITESIQWLANQDGKALADDKGVWREEVPEAYRQT